MNIDNEDFGTLAVCAIRYCRGRQTYMPELVRGIIKGHLSEISDTDLQVLINDCGYTLKWEDEIEPKEWAEWKEMLIAEQERRKKMEFEPNEITTFSKVLTLSQDVGEGDLLELLRELGDQFNPSDELEEPYRWAIYSAVNHIARNMVIHSVHDNLLYILNNRELSDSECRDKCTEYLTKFPQGKWKFDGWSIYCSECGFEHLCDSDNYCPNCGVKMKGGAE